MKRDYTISFEKVEKCGEVILQRYLVLDHTGEPIRCDLTDLDIGEPPRLGTSGYYRNPYPRLDIAQTAIRYHRTWSTPSTTTTSLLDEHGKEIDLVNEARLEEMQEEMMRGEPFRFDLNLVAVIVGCFAAIALFAVAVIWR